MVEILGAGHDVTAKALREKQQEIHREQPGIEPETFWQLGEELPYSVDVQYAHSGELGYYDVILARRPLGQAAAAIFPDHTKIDPRQQCVVETPLHDYANNPLQAKVTRKLTPQLRSYLDKKLPDYMVPSAFVIMDAFPLNQNGKINRRAFPKPDTLRPDLAEAFVAPGTPVEKILAGIWAEGLGADELHPLEQIGVHDRFIALGGNSLLATQVVSRIRDIFQIDLPLSYGFNLTIAELAGQLDERGRAGGIDVHEIAEIFMQISQLSDEEARALLE